MERRIAQKQNRMSKMAIVMAALFVWTAVFCLLPTTVRAADGAEFGGGSGTASNPWRIFTAVQLDAVRNYCGPENQSYYFKLENDIDLTDFIDNNQDAAVREYGWVPILGDGDSGDARRAFFGSFDGGSHVVSGLWCNRQESDQLAGLFGYVINARIQNLGLVLNDEKGGIYTNGYAAGGIAGMQHGLTGAVMASGTDFANPDRITLTRSETVIENCYVIGDVEAGYNAGGIVGSQGVGYFDDGSTVVVRNCYMKGAVTATYNAGGIVGAQNLTYKSNTIEDCYMVGTVASYNVAGGIVGWAECPSEESNCVGNVKNCVSAAVGKDGNAFLPLENGILGDMETYGSKAGRYTIAGCYAACADEAAENEQPPEGQGITPIQVEKIKSAATYDAWDSEVWGIYDGQDTPYLKSFANAILVTPVAITVTAVLLVLAAVVVVLVVRARAKKKKGQAG